MTDDTGTARMDNTRTDELLNATNGCRLSRSVLPESPGSFLPLIISLASNVVTTGQPRCGVPYAPLHISMYTAARVMGFRQQAVVPPAVWAL
jgi:hypothetical protein